MNAEALELRVVVPRPVVVETRAVVLPAGELERIGRCGTRGRARPEGLVGIQKHVCVQIDVPAGELQRIFADEACDPRVVVPRPRVGPEAGLAEKRDRPGPRTTMDRLRRSGSASKGHTAGSRTGRFV
jgi:hypothetical protein